MFCTRLQRASACLVSFFLTSFVVQAQGTTSLRGIVTDAQQAAVADAAVSLLQKDRGVTRSTTSQKDGSYQFLQLAPGAYSLTISAPGFATIKNENLVLNVDSPATLDAKMEVSSTTSTVEVVDESPQLNTVNATVGNAFQQKEVEQLPLQTRNVVELLSIQPGVTQTGEVMGARRDQNNITLDGIDSNDNQNALSGQNGTTQNQGFNSALPVPLDSVMEFRVTVAGQDATAGRSSGGQVSLITRSGTNQFHGSAYEYNRNTDFTANRWFNNRAGIDRPQLVRNQFGASLGGPIKKDRIFFFLNYERRIDSSALSQERSVPTESFKQGIIKVALGDGSQVATLTPAQVAQIDPLHIGENSQLLSYLNQFPAGNDPAFGADNGLNYTGLRFNAPSDLDNRAYVARFDWNVDSAGKHVVSFRGTLSNNQYTLSPAQYPGQTAASQQFSDNRGFSVRYTATLTPSLVNVATVGLTRVGYSQSGAVGTGFSVSDIDPVNNFNVRPYIRINPTVNAADDLTWTKGKHTIQTGFNFRNIDNSTSSYSNAWPYYRYSQGILVGLGEDLQNNVSSYLGGATLQNPNSTTDAFGTLLGLVNSLDVTYHYDKNGNAIPIGDPTKYDFIAREYEGYVQDTWKARNNLTLTFGLRYQYDSPPFEASGLQVNSTPGLDTYFANRVYAQANGIPGNQLPNGDRLVYNLAGPVNGSASWYKPDKNNFAPRFSIAYSPTSSTVIRAGAAMVYDQYGSDLAVNAANLGSSGLSTSLGFPDSYNFTDSPRYNGSYPALTTAPSGGFPFTPPDISSISGTQYGINPNLLAPYSYVLNFTVSHQFRGNYALDVSYVGRLAHKLLAQQDTFSPLIYFKDPKSGQTWVQADTTMRQLYNNGSGVSTDAVQTNPSLIPANPFVENMFPGLANYYFPGSASANYYYGIYGIYGGSDLDNLHSLDRIGAPNNCITVTGCYTFFAPQGSADPTWSNSANSIYHGLAVTFRHNLSHGLAFNLNYTWSHAIDNVSSPTDNSGQFGGDIQNAFQPGQARASSDYDVRHQFNANVLYALPVGHGQRFLGSSRLWLDEIVGGWQVSSLIRLQTGLPTYVLGNFVFPTNYWNSSIAVPTTNVKTGNYIDENGVPNLFSSINAASDFVDAYPGQSGSRNIIRLPGLKNVDLALIKDFHLPWEGHSLQFRAEAFNLFNWHSFTYGLFNTDSTTNNYTTSFSNLSLQSPSTFGEFTDTTDPRVLQLSLRYNF